MGSNEHSEWMTVREVAEWTGYHPDHLRELIREGKIGAEKKGMSWWVSRQSVEEYLAAAKAKDDGRWGPKD